jgi:large subunit ribosomal protein L23
MTVYSIIKKPIITEKTEMLRREKNTYTFEVDPKANKIEIKKAVEKVFGVKVGEVNTINVKPTTKRYGMKLYKTKLTKKAIVKVLEGTIEYFPEV